jgi:predicted NBD/HSP70 family sugar kinase/DNA-binding transcriptional ArsR family regulator
VTPAKPSLELLRSLTDEHVLRALMDHPRLTRAEIATHTGLSKPTASESARRLTEVGLLRDTGERTTGRGRVGSYYALAADLGTALAVDISPTAGRRRSRRRLRAHGEAGRATAPPTHRPGTRRRRTAHGVRQATTGSVPPRRRQRRRPVDRVTGRLVHLPDAPFLVGELSPADILAPLVDGPVETDNDVNWAARAEQAHAGPGALADFALFHLGEGLGCALVSDGEVRRGHHGLSGEIAHLVTTGPGLRAMPFTQVFAELGLRRPGTTAIDDERLLRALDGQAAVREQLARAIAGAIAALIALADPEVVVLGGSWGTPPRTATGDPHPPRPAATLGGATARRRSRPARPRRRPTTRDPPAAGLDHHPQPRGLRRIARHRVRPVHVAPEGDGQVAPWTR